MAFTVGRLVKYIPQYFVVYTFLTLGLGIVIFLLWWEREPSYFASLLIVFGLGLCGGTWLTTITCEWLKIDILSREPCIQARQFTVNGCGTDINIAVIMILVVLVSVSHVCTICYRRK